MRTIAWLLTGVAALSTAAATPPAGSRGKADAGRVQRADGLCRRAAALPSLPAEVDQPQTARTMPDVARESATAVMPPSDAPPPPALPSPPPPPSPPAAVADSAVSDIVLTGTRVGRGKRAEAEAVAVAPAPIVALPAPTAGRAAPSAFAPRAPSEQASPAGLLTAGEHDDLLNPELYARYVTGFLKGEPLSGVPRVDTERVLTVAVHDARGQAVPFAGVTLTCADGNTLTLATLADGQATFFPDLDRLGQEVTIGVGGALPRRAVVAPTPGTSVQTITLGGNGAGNGAAVRALDLAFVVDTTGSMGDELRFLQSELRAIVARTAAAHPGLSLRVALIFYRDRGDVYLTRTSSFTGDLDRVQADLARQNADGGGDEPESMEVAMARAAALPWRAAAVKSLFLVADAPPHADDVGATWAAAESLRAARVQIVPVAASGVERGAEYIMRAMAAASQGRYLFLTDDSGIGNAHAPPAIDCYQVARLGDAMARVIDSQLSGRRIEAPPGAVIRTVGTYDAGRCILPTGWEQQR